MTESFETLSRRAVLRRLRPLALKALERYDLCVRDLRPVGVYTNTLFRVRTTAGDSLLLRICRPGWRTDDDLHSEALWLQALYRETDIGAPRPLLDYDGQFIVRAGAANVPGERRCVLMSWLPGAPLAGRLTEANLFKMGVLFARLHRHSAGFSPPAGFTTRRMDQVLARGEVDTLFGEAHRQAGAPHAWDVFEAVRDRVLTAYRALCADPAGPRVIHHDLWHGNIKVHRGQLHPLDFEDTVWGYPVQDLAMALQDLMTDVEPARFEPLQAALQRGYESVAPWPETHSGQIDTFRAGRVLWVANYVATYQRQYLGEHVERLALTLERYLQTGLLRRT